jgi:diphthamide biosynthesis methyltransferase
VFFHFTYTLFFYDGGVLYLRNLLQSKYASIFRELVEQGAEELLCGGAEGDVALLVVGDPFGATTHTDLVLRKASK